VSLELELESQASALDVWDAVVRGPVGPEETVRAARVPGQSECSESAAGRRPEAAAEEAAEAEAEEEEEEEEVVVEGLACSSPRWALLPRKRAYRVGR
jgi:hypothetical protein